MREPLLWRIDAALWRLGLVRRAKYENLEGAYRDVWRWWEKEIRRN